MSLATGGNDFDFFFGPIRQYYSRRSKMHQKIDPFCQVDIRVLDIFSVKKIVFSTFSKLLYSYLGKVLELFLTLKGLLLVVFSALMVDK